jgi:hypothetical protein
MAFSSAAFFAANSATGRPTISRSMCGTFIMRQRAAQQRHVLRRLGVLVVHLLGAEGVGGQADVRPDLVEQRPDRDADGLAPFGSPATVGVSPLDG